MPSASQSSAGGWAMGLSAPTLNVSPPSTLARGGREAGEGAGAPDAVRVPVQRGGEIFENHLRFSFFCFLSFLSFFFFAGGGRNPAFFNNNKKC